MSENTITDRKIEGNTLTLLSVKDLNCKSFKIGSYQRGFKWGKKEILELLNDIDAYDENKGLYCLQPLILKPICEEKQSVSVEGEQHEIFLENEVIDGQQRITTLYIILKYLEFKNFICSDYLFKINFETRERSGDFLVNNLNQIFNLSLSSITKEELLKKEYQDLSSLNVLWEDFISKNDEFDNVDVYHFFTVTCYLIRWFEINLNFDCEREEFIDKFLKNVKIIWYSLDDTNNDSEVVELFLNNNKGKIGLTSSELIKALFVLNIKNREASYLFEIKVSQFTTEWDMIEKQLQNDSFWYFIQPNEEKYVEGTRIDFLFDLHFKKTDKSDDFFSYRKLETIYNAGKDFTETWDYVLQLYYKLLNWYNDSTTYHLVGFITNSGIKKIQDLINKYKGKNQSSFKEELKNIITDKFSKKEKNEDNKWISLYNLKTINYKDNYSECREILLLYNVLYYINSMAGYKFPFELFIKEKWSIEHIIPQNPKDLKDIKHYKQWIEDILEYTDIPFPTNLSNDLKKANSIEEVNNNVELKSAIDELVTESEDITHLMSNLLLLDRNTNSSLGNKPFSEKRKTVLSFDKEGINENGKPVFIPIESLNAFNKVNSEEINIENWTKDDGDNYIDSIQKRLQKFLPEN